MRFIPERSRSEVTLGASPGSSVLEPGRRATGASRPVPRRPVVYGLVMATLAAVLVAVILTAIMVEKLRDMSSLTWITPIT